MDRGRKPASERQMNTRTLILVLSLFSGLAHGEEYGEEDFVDPDPWWAVNEKTHNVNDALDRSIVRPVALGYRKVIPGFIRNRVSNVFSNIGDINDAVNNTLQGKFAHGMNDIGRLLVNTTIGIGGLFDPASAMGFTDHQEDFGQTLARWGVPSGPYLVLPFLGPSSVRDGIGRILDGRVNAVRYLDPVAHRNSVSALNVVQLRTDLLPADSVVFGDKYIFYREAYMQRRTFLVNDGVVEDDFDDDF
jgi:phospholipid-binding lipoprotein MlaA